MIIPSDPLAQKITVPGFLLSINACPISKGPVNGVPCTPFLTAKEAMEYGLVDHVLERLQPGQMANRTSTEG